MKNEITWYDKYILALKEYLSIREIMKLRSISQPAATKIRDEVVKYCLINKIPLEASKVPTEIVFKITNRDLKFYHDKMLLEYEALNLRSSVTEG